MSADWAGYAQEDTDGSDAQRLLPPGREAEERRVLRRISLDPHARWQSQRRCAVAVGAPVFLAGVSLAIFLASGGVSRGSASASYNAAPDLGSTGARQNKVDMALLIAFQQRAAALVDSTAPREDLSTVLRRKQRQHPEEFRERVQKAKSRAREIRVAGNATTTVAATSGPTTVETTGPSSTEASAASTTAESTRPTTALAEAREATSGTTTVEIAGPSTTEASIASTTADSTKPGTTLSEVSSGTTTVETTGPSTTEASSASTTVESTRLTTEVAEAATTTLEGASTSSVEATTAPTTSEIATTTSAGASTSSGEATMAPTTSEIATTTPAGASTSSGEATMAPTTSEVATTAASAATSEATTASTSEASTAPTTSEAPAATTTTVPPPQCWGIGDCPEYPRPYGFGEWPTSYDVRGKFPADFVWGLGTAAYQIEGAYREDGRGASIWDTYTGANTVGMPGGDCSYCCKAAPCVPNSNMVAKGATGNVACDHYHSWRSDIALMKSMGLKNYRFSLSWPRLIPTGRVADGVNQKAVSFYSSLLDGLLAAGITPFVTLYHWDLPQALFSPPEVEGWWSSDKATGEPNGQIIPDWLDYVRLCFENFGDRVKFWMTFNEAWTFTWLASGWGKAPGIAEYNDMTRFPYIAAHNVLVAHALAVDMYRREYQKKQGGRIGITNNADWHEPATDKPDDVGAAERSLLVSLGWFADPIFSGTGDYSEAMKRIAGDRLPKFSEDEKLLINGSADFFGLNHYGTGWAHHMPDIPGIDNAHVTMSEEGFVQGESPWLFSSAWGFRKLLNWVDRRYHHPPIYVTENGWSMAANSAVDGVRDDQRVMFYANYTSEMLKAIDEDGIDIRGYFAWSLMDNFEWEKGYVERFGTSFVDFNFGADPDAPVGDSPKPTRGQSRTRKDSSCWLEAVWRTNELVDPGGESFRGCARSSTMHGSYDARGFAGCVRRVIVSADGRTGRIAGKDSLSGLACNGTDEKSWAVDATFSGGTVVADFSGLGDTFPAFRPGPGVVVGYWDDVAKLLFWGDDSVWTQQADQGAQDLIVQ